MRARSLILTTLFMLAACGREGAPLVSPSPTPRPSPTAAAEETEAPDEPEATESPTPSPSPTVSPSPTPAACRNSTTPACGAFRFDPAIDNDEDVDVGVTFSPTNPKPGEKVEFTLEATDPDSPHLFLGTYRFSADGPGVVADDFPGTCPRAYGAWDAPEDKNGSVTRTLTYTYREAGTYKALFSFFSHSYTPDDHPWPDEPPGDEDGVCIDPRDSAGKRTVTIRVAE